MDVTVDAPPTPPKVKVLDAQHTSGPAAGHEGPTVGGAWRAAPRNFCTLAPRRKLTSAVTRNGAYRGARPRVAAAVAAPMAHVGP